MLRNWRSTKRYRDKENSPIYKDRAVFFEYKRIRAKVARFHVQQRQRILGSVTDSKVLLNQGSKLIIL